MSLKIPYFIYTSGENYNKNTDYDIKFTSPGLHQNFYEYYVLQLSRYGQTDRGIVPIKEIVKNSTYAVLQTDDKNWFFLFISPYEDAPYNDTSQGRRPNCAILGMVVADKLINEKKIGLSFILNSIIEKKLYKISFREEDRDEGFKKRPDYIEIDDVDNNISFEPWKSYIYINGKITEINSTVKILYKDTEKPRSNKNYFVNIIILLIPLLILLYLIFIPSKQKKPEIEANHPFNDDAIKFQKDLMNFKKAKDYFNYYVLIDDTKINSLYDFKKFLGNPDKRLSLINIFNYNDKIDLSLKDLYIINDNTDKLLKTSFLDDFNDCITKITLQFIVEEGWQLIINTKSDFKMEDLIKSHTILCDDQMFDKTSDIKYNQDFNDLSKVIFFTKKTSSGIYKASLLIKGNPVYLLLANNKECLDIYNDVNKLNDHFRINNTSNSLVCKDPDFLKNLTEGKPHGEGIPNTKISKQEFLIFIKKAVKQ